jgi:hypothetical protein
LDLMMIRLTALAVIAALTAPARAERVCFTGPMQATVISGSRAGVAGSGGVIVAAGQTMPDWRFRDLNRVVRPEVVVIAPGLAIYHPPPTAGAEVVLENADHQLIARRERAFSIEAAPAAPLVESITTSVVDRRTYVSATFGGKTPDTAVIAIVSRVERDRTVPLSWVEVGPKVRVVSVWHTPGGCDQIVPTWVEPKAGERVVITWVDDTGRLSEPSKPIVISGASKRK